MQLLVLPDSYRHQHAFTKHCNRITKRRTTVHSKILSEGLEQWFKQSFNRFIKSTNRLLLSVRHRAKIKQTDRDNPPIAIRRKLYNNIITSVSDYLLLSVVTD